MPSGHTTQFTDAVDDSIQACMEGCAWHTRVNAVMLDINPLRMELKVSMQQSTEYEVSDSLKKQLTTVRGKIIGILRRQTR